ncbi:glycoside hydrolase family 3 C-terminal domain-containing protein [Stenotrophomonas sp. MMGLT7]|uniref:beta-glucosidase n=1 Tax=Stenotrophomonas sp. MMGLT7 TaxID=2901227 RepID=UPI001E31F0DA|nr:glycoside hydrolase family 3 C-terminal domain-containing protein [Stenotrophomonas sp. MMGLT7]MCD7098787.1 glycoside hydrolase family 3 C-terminal domain-containing protein [Stenotrophomonas sp. MMGLT7]
MTRRPLCLALILFLLPLAAVAQPRPWLDPTLPADARARAVLAQMSLEEKLKLLNGDVELDDIGTGVNPCIGHIAANPRLGLPELCMADGPAGVSNGMTGVTVFPAPLLGAASWNPELMRRYGEALGAEHAAKRHNVVLAPTINIARSVRWGRLAETLGEDPLLTSTLGTAIIQGVQSHPIMADAKHFAAYNQETDRFGDAPGYDAVNIEVGERALHQIYFPAFKAAVQEGKVGSVMCAYNRINGRYACEQPDTFAVLRKDWGFDGFIVADWYFGHRSLLSAVRAGMDISMPGGKNPFGFEDFYGEPLARAVREGTVSGDEIDAMALNVLTPMFRLGLVDHPLPHTVQADVRTPAHSALARELAEQGTVLLKNAGGVLPLSAELKTLAVIGDDAGANVSATQRYGGFVNYPGMRIVTPLEALRRRVPKATWLIYEAGTAGIAPLPLMDASELAGAGWTARYYDNGGFHGEPKITRVEPGIDIIDKVPDGLGTPWSARWTSTLVPKSTGLYRFSATGGSDIRLFVAGREIATTWKQSFSGTAHGVAELQAGVPVQLRLDYASAAGLAHPGVRLGWQRAQDSRIAAAVEVARQADVALVFVGDHVSEGADRTSLALPGDQNALIEAVARANPRTVVVLNTVGPVAMPWLEQVAGVVQGWYPGEQAGNAIAAVLYGDVDARGRLPLTFPRGEDHPLLLPAARFPGIGNEAAYDEGLLVGYRGYHATGDTPLFPFGFGLSYTRFALDRFQLVPRAGRVVPGATVRVTNTGERTGTQTVQLYLTWPEDAGEPPRQLVGFAQATLDAGASAVLDIPVAASAGQVWDVESRAWKYLPGRYRLEVGTSSADMVAGLEFVRD